MYAIDEMTYQKICKVDSLAEAVARGDFYNMKAEQLADVLSILSDLAYEIKKGVKTTDVKL